uniref:Uncharacterized protein n=1 Tax=Metapenaeus joyneri majanivirus TaxID=2984280 RepID=A0A9C7BZV1_9VIRU|nr:MAG: hypothetical protein [Metapenaeus joyneri majanivirus]
MSSKIFDEATKKEYNSLKKKVTNSSGENKKSKKLMIDSEDENEPALVDSNIIMNENKLEELINNLQPFSSEYKCSSDEDSSSNNSSSSSGDENNSNDEGYESDKDNNISNNEIGEVKSDTVPIPTIVGCALNNGIVHNNTNSDKEMIGDVLLFEKFLEVVGEGEKGRNGWRKTTTTKEEEEKNSKKKWVNKKEEEDNFLRELRG